MFSLPDCGEKETGNKTRTSLPSLSLSFFLSLCYIFLPGMERERKNFCSLLDEGRVADFIS